MTEAGPAPDARRPALACRRALAVIIGSLLVVALLGSGWALYTYGSLDPSVLPQRMHVFAGVYRTQGEVEHGLRDPRTVVLEPGIGQWPLVMPWDRPDMPAGATPTVVWLRTGSDAYVAYELSGGP